MSTFISAFYRYRFFVLCLVCWVVFFFHSLDCDWYGDFWEHCSAVKELSVHPWLPKHPQLVSDATHIFFSPYSLLVGLLARVLLVDALTILSITGLFNLLLLFVGLHRFIAAFFKHDSRSVSFFALLLMLLFWGRDAWNYSGFFHVDVLGFVLPYPSTNATALALLALGFYPAWLQEKRWPGYLAIFLLSTFIFISHPLTFIFLAVGLTAITLTRETFILPEWLLLGGLLAGSTALAHFWPYFSMPQVILGTANVFHASNKIMYHQVLSRTWPALSIIPFILAALLMNKDRRNTLFVMLLLLSGIYGYGYLSGKYSYGRVITYIVLILHVYAAQQICGLEEHLRQSVGKAEWKPAILSIGVIVLGVCLSFSPLAALLQRALAIQPPSYRSYAFLDRQMGRYETIVADLKTAWRIPAMGGKVVAADHPFAFIPDHEERQAAIHLFFAPGTALETRQSIIQRYQARYILLRKTVNRNWVDIKNGLLSLEAYRMKYADDEFIMIEKQP